MLIHLLSPQDCYTSQGAFMFTLLLDSTQQEGGPELTDLLFLPLNLIMKTAYMTPLHQTHTFLVSTLFTKEKNERYACPICQKRFNRPSALQTHSYTHTGEKPYACDFHGCGRRFSVVSNLKRHSKVHNRSHFLQRTRLTSGERNIFVQRLIARSSQHHQSASSITTAPADTNATGPPEAHHPSSQHQTYPPPSRLSVLWLTQQENTETPYSSY